MINFCPKIFPIKVKLFYQHKFLNINSVLSNMVV